MIFDNQIKALADVHQYNATVSSMKCTTGEQYSGDTFIRSFDMLEITVLDDAFIASDIPNKTCNLIPKEYPEGSVINLWHDEGFIYQLMSDGKMLLPYESLIKSVNAHRDNNRGAMYFFVFIVFWFFSFKPFFRAVLNKQKKSR